MRSPVVPQANRRAPPPPPLAERRPRIPQRAPHALAGRVAAASLALALALSCALAPQAFAERADQDKPVNLEADRVELDDARKESLFVGNVTLTQGTLTIRADQITVKQQADGFQYGIALGKPVHFRQKREGFDEYIEGFSERLEYDGKTEKVQLFTNARIQRGADEVRGDYISYNAVTEVFQVSGGKAPPGAAGSRGRVRVIIQPKNKPGAAPAPGSTSLKPSTDIQNSNP